MRLSNTMCSMTQMMFYFCIFQQCSALMNWIHLKIYFANLKTLLPCYFILLILAIMAKIFLTGPYGP